MEDEIHVKTKQAVWSCIHQYLKVQYASKYKCNVYKHSQDVKT